MSKKKPKQQNNIDMSKSHFELRKVVPLTPNQQKTFSAYEAGFNLVLHGSPGTGKTYISLYMALKSILEESCFQKIVIIRSVVSSRDIGFLPGNIKEKIRIYEEPYREICDDLFGRGDGYEILKIKGLIEFTSTSFLRGLTYNNAVIILDEAQNLEQHEINTVMTRVGNNSKMIVCGDFKQTDLVRNNQNSGLLQLLKIIKHMKSFSTIEFGLSDIVRSGFVREYLLAKEIVE
jgi:phosphate starvation-inducible PhoH-like protein